MAVTVVTGNAEYNLKLFQRVLFSKKYLQYYLKTIKNTLNVSTPDMQIDYAENIEINLFLVSCM